MPVTKGINVEVLSNNGNPMCTGTITKVSRMKQRVSVRFDSDELGVTFVRSFLRNQRAGANARQFFDNTEHNTNNGYFLAPE